MTLFTVNWTFANSCSLSQILGFDILLMKNLKPILLEVNSSPSMRIEHEKEVKGSFVELQNKHELLCSVSALCEYPRLL